MVMMKLCGQIKVAVGVAAAIWLSQVTRHAEKADASVQPQMY
jgi:hypothetical protein